MSYPTFMWQDHHGAWHRRRAHVSSTRIPFGTPVAVLYDPQRPHRAMIDTDIFNGTFVFKVGLGIATIGTPLVLIALTLGALFA